ncbi:MAG: alpha/beta fold hydrolase [Candidatus Lokiarchaeota archaeon]|nr:alpha/beta fold hydrolase [Candidatus Lokiarchaeota archaeon]
MLTITHKRIILILFDLIFSAYIWDVNASWGNAFNICLILSTTTFLIIYTPFEIYWSFRDIYFDRWMPIKFKNIKTSKINIEVGKSRKGKSKYIVGLLISSNDNEIVKAKSSLVVICHGFSDTKETLQYYYLPLALQGFTILVYDARGTGESKKVGRRSQFLKRIEDFKKVIDWIKINNQLKNYKVSSVGFSIGAITVLCGGFSNETINKIIAISAMSNYKQNLPKYDPIVMLSYLLKGVKLFPNKIENTMLSPYSIIESSKKSLSDDNWRKLSKKVSLIHAKNDRIIKFKNFQENVKLLNLSTQNTLILNYGGHTQKKNELLLVAASLKFLTS